MNLVGSRAEAKSVGAKRYYTGNACPNGHIAERTTARGQCVQCSLSLTKAWIAKNSKRIGRAQQNWHLRNPDARRAHEAKRRSRKFTSADHYTSAQVQALKEKQKHKCIYCSRSIKSHYQIDHIQSLALGGNNSISNIQILCERCNKKKYAKDPIQFAQEIGLLL